MKPVVVVVARIPPRGRVGAGCRRKYGAIPEVVCVCGGVSEMGGGDVMYDGGRGGVDGERGGGPVQVFFFGDAGCVGSGGGGGTVVRFWSVLACRTSAERGTGSGRETERAPETVVLLF